MAERVRPLRAWRMDRGWSQSELAAEAGVNVSTISGIENGKRPEPHPSTRKRLADALGCAPSQIGEFADGGGSGTAEQPGTGQD